MSNKFNFPSPDNGVGFAMGQQTTVAAADTIATGLAEVYGVVVSLDTDPADANMFVSGTFSGGNIVVKTWKSADGTDPTPVAASAFGKKVNWFAWGRK